MTSAAIEGCSQPGPAQPAAQLTTTGSLARMFHPIRVHLAICALLSGLGAAAGLMPYIAVAEITRILVSVEGPADVSDVIWFWVVTGGICAALRLVLVFISSRLGHYADAEILHDIRVQIVRHLGKLPLGWFKATGSGAVKKVMTHDLEDMHQLIAHALGEVVGAMTALLVGCAYLFLVDWRLAMVTLGVLLAVFLFFQVAMRSMSGHMARLVAAEGQISAASIEYADGISVVKTFTAGGRILDRFAKAVHEHGEAMRVWVEETRYSSALSRLFASEMTVLAAVMVAGLLLLQANQLGLAELLPFLVVGIGLPTSVVPAIQGSQGIRKGRVAAANVEELLAHPPLPEPAYPRTPSGHRLEFDGVSFSYDSAKDAIRDISITFEPGTVTALVGSSGAGKSTIASLIPRFFDVTRGAIRLGGIDIRHLDQATLLSSMSLVFQDVVLLRDTVAENIRISRPDATDEEVVAAARAAHIDHVIRTLPEGYGTMLGTAGTGLSGGESQRLTIARAILSEAPIVVLDEATASLDPDSETEVQKALAELARGRTVIVIAHRLHTIQHADQIVVLDGGGIAETGRHAALLAHDGIYARLWRAQQGASA